MSTSRKAVFSLGLGVLALAVCTPALSGAQSYSGGSVLVYLQVLQQDNNPHAPGDFLVNVSGNTPSPASFPGSVNGVVSALGSGSYNVFVSGNTYGYAPSYSQGCSGTVNSSQQPLCVITMTAQGGIVPVTPYPYPYNPGQQTLFCSSQYQTVNLGMPATFTAQGSGPGSYTWATAYRTFLNIGSTLTTTFPATGVQIVTVASGSQTATCTVNVTASGAPVATYPPAQVTQYPYSYNTPVYGGYTQSAPAVYVSPTYVPRLPNTGFAPQDSASVAFAVVALLGAFGLAFPYVRKALAVALG